MREWFALVVFYAGLSCILLGAGLISEALFWIAMGVILIVLAMSWLSQAKNDKAEAHKRKAAHEHGYQAPRHP
jgi:hypothetical protein